MGGTGFECEGVGAGVCLTEGVAAEHAGGELGEPKLALGWGSPAEDGVDGEGVLDIDDEGDGGVDGGEGFDGEDGVKEGSAGTVVFCGDFDAEEAEFSKGGDEAGEEVLVLVHLADVGRDGLGGEAADGGLEEEFFFGEVGERGGSGHAGGPPLGRGKGSRRE